MKRAVWPAVGLTIIAFFGAYAVIGPNGVLAYGDYKRQLVKREKDYAELDRRRAVLKNRVALLEPGSCQPRHGRRDGAQGAERGASGRGDRAVQEIDTASPGGGGGPAAGSWRGRAASATHGENPLHRPASSAVPLLRRGRNLEELPSQERDQVLAQPILLRHVQPVRRAVVFDQLAARDPRRGARALASIGTVLSLVPWTISVGTRNAARSGRKSVWPKASSAGEGGLQARHHRQVGVQSMQISSLTGVRDKADAEEVRV